MDDKPTNSWQGKRNVDVFDLEKKLHEVFHDLAQKRTSLEDVHRQLNAECSLKQDLKLEVERLNRVIHDNRLQLEAATKAFHQCEDGLNAARDTSIRLKQQLEASVKINDVLREQAGATQLENCALRSKVDELERQIRTGNMIKESSLAKQAKLHTFLESLNLKVRNLEKNHRSFERLASVAKEMGNKNKLLIEHYNSVVKHNQDQREIISKEIVNLKAENELLRNQVNQAKSISQNPKEKEFMKDIMEEWQISVNEMTTRGGSEKTESERLQQTLNDALEAQAHLQNLEMSACQRIIELEKHLEEERELHKKPLCDVFQQTEKVYVTEVGCGPENISVQHSQVQTEPAAKCNREIQTEILITVTETEDRGSSIDIDPVEFIKKEQPSSLIRDPVTQSVSHSTTTLEGNIYSGFSQYSDSEDISDLPTQKIYRDL